MDFCWLTWLKSLLSNGYHIKQNLKMKSKSIQRSSSSVYEAGGFLANRISEFHICINISDKTNFWRHDIPRGKLKGFKICIIHHKKRVMIKRFHFVRRRFVVENQVVKVDLKEIQFDIPLTKLIENFATTQIYFHSTYFFFHFKISQFIL